MNGSLYEKHTVIDVHLIVGHYGGAVEAVDLEEAVAPVYALRDGHGPCPATCRPVRGVPGK